MKFSFYRFKKYILPLLIGTLFTLTICYLAINFYASGVDKREAHPNIAIQFLHRLDQATIDWRLRFRGARKGSSDVVILAVDEKALTQEGQWPWPRVKFKAVIERLMQGGARVIGLDVIWSEPEQNNSVHALSKLRTEMGTTDHDHLINKFIGQSRTDSILANTIKKHNDSIVLGNFFNPPILGGFDRSSHGYKNLCFEELYRLHPHSQLMDEHEPVISTIDQTLIHASDEIPEIWAEVLIENFEKIKQKTEKDFLEQRKKKNKSLNLSKTAKIELDQEILLSQWNYCRRWLHLPDHERPDEHFESYKSTWNIVQEDEETYQKMSFEDGLDHFKAKIHNSKIEMIGHWTINIPEIHRAAKYSGYFNAKQDSDGTIRRSFLMVRTGKSLFPSMSLMTYLRATNQKIQLTVTENKKDTDGKFKAIAKLELIDEDGNVTGEVPVDKDGHLAINYAGPQHMFPHLSIADVLNDEETLSVTTKKYDKVLGGWKQVTEEHNKKEFYKNKIFVVGATAVGIFDLRVTPFEEDYPGVETHANIIDNLIRKDFLKRHPNEEMYMILFILVFGLGLTVIVSKFGAVTGVVSASSVLVLLGWLDWKYFFTQGTVISIVFPFTLLIGVYTVLTIYKYFTEERNKKQLKGTFGKYVSPAIVEEILAHPDNIELGGRKEEVTVFFSDVRGFTTISETLTPTELSDLLNDYLTPMTEIIFSNKGTLDKYIGDAIMAFFGAPIASNTHADDACRASLQNIERLKVLQDELKKKDLPHIDVGIGLNTGEVSVGNMGSNIVRNYTIMGDAVNLGARLEGITKQYGARIIISEFTEKQISRSFITREVDCVRVKGKLKPVRIYELLGENDAPENMVEVAKWFKEGYQLYHQKNWNEAIEKFKKASSLRQNPEGTAQGDPSSIIYIKRCQNYLQTPPPDDWDGVFVMTTK